MADEPAIEVGETAADGLRYWRAKEAVRHGEARLTFQATALAALETRATSLVGWAAAGATAMVSALLLATLSRPGAWAASAALGALVLAAAAGVTVLWPRGWTPFGDPNGVLDSQETTELGDLEALAGGLGLAAAGNAKRLVSSGRLLTIGLGLLALAPACAGLAWLAAR